MEFTIFTHHRDKLSRLKVQPAGGWQRPALRVQLIHRQLLTIVGCVGSHIENLHALHVLHGARRPFCDSERVSKSPAKSQKRLSSQCSAIAVVVLIEIETAITVIVSVKVFVFILNGWCF